MPAFNGFPKETFAFFRDVAAHNEKVWFDAHRDDYRRYVLEPAMDLVVDLGASLRTLSKHVHAEPKVNGSISRINRDIRFSKDKRPYKTSQELWFWEGSSRSLLPGYWLSISAERLVLGAGMHRFDRPTLERYRAAVADPRSGDALATVTSKLRRDGYDIGRVEYKRVPSGYDGVDGERTELLKHGGLYAGWMRRPPPREVSTSRFADYCFAEYRKMRPIQEWLVANLG